MKDERIYLGHIRDAISDIRAYASVGEEAFLSDRMRQDAIIRKPEIIGEAVKRLSEDSARGKALRFPDQLVRLARFVQAEYRIGFRQQRVRDDDVVMRRAAELQGLFAQLDGFLVLPEPVAQVAGQGEEAGVFGGRAACLGFQRGQHRHGALGRDADDFHELGIAVAHGRGVRRHGNAGNGQ